MDGVQILTLSDGTELPSLEKTKVIQDAELARKGLCKVIATFAFVEIDITNIK
jgi:hypothetical protein